MCDKYSLHPGSVIKTCVFTVIDITTEVGNCRYADIGTDTTLLEVHSI